MGADEVRVRVIENVSYGEAGGSELLLDIAMPEERGDGKLPVALYVHGGAWMWGDKADPMERGFIVELAKRGYFAVSANYRLTDVATFPAQLHDAKAAVRWIRAHGGDYGASTERIGAFGHSAGGHLSSLLGLTGGAEELEGTSGNAGYSSRVQAVATWSGPSDMIAMLEVHEHPQSPEAMLVGGGPEDRPERARRASPVAYASNDGAPPFLLVHGDEDEVVPFSQSEALYKALANATLIAVKGANHGFIGGNLDWTDILNMTAVFFDKYVRA